MFLKCPGGRCLWRPQRTIPKARHAAHSGGEIRPRRKHQHGHRIRLPVSRACETRSSCVDGSFGPAPSEVYAAYKSTVVLWSFTGPVPWALRLCHVCEYNGRADEKSSHLSGGLIRKKVKRASGTAQGAPKRPEAASSVMPIDRSADQAVGKVSRGADRGTDKKGTWQSTGRIR